MYQLVLRLTIITVLTFSFAIPSLAQSFFDFGKKQATPPTSANSAVMSADQFKNTVTKMGQETKNNLSDQVSQQFLKQPTLPAQQPPPPIPIPTSETNLVAPTPVPPVQPIVPAPPVPPTQPLVTPSNTPPPSQPNESTVSPYNAQPIAPPPAQNQPYTGFGTGTQPNNPDNTTNTSPPSENTGGWNIKY